MKDTRFVSLLAVSALLAASLAGCGSSASSVASSASSEAVSSVAESAVSEAASESAAASSARTLEDGTYTAEFDTDSSMFHVNEARDGKGTLTVEDGQMTLHISSPRRLSTSMSVWRRMPRTMRPTGSSPPPTP